MAVRAASPLGSTASITRLRSPVPLPILLVVLSFVCPSELSLYVAGLRLPPHRVALILLFPFVLQRLLAGRDVRLRSFDVLVLLYAAWSLIAFVAHGEQAGGLVFGGSVALEAAGGYLVARTWVRDSVTFMASLRLLLVAVAIAGLVALPETLLGAYFTHDFLRGLIGGEPMPAVEQRLGYFRAASVFDHPIHLGTFCVSILSLIWFAESRAPVRWACVLLVAVATLTSLSSAPMLCLALQIGLIVLERVTRGIAGRLGLLFVVGLGLFLGAMLIGNRSPFAVIATGFTIDSWTGYYRLLIWEYGLETVANFPLLGIGLADWERPRWMYSSTVDAFWLVIAMRTGIPALLLLALAIVLLAAAVIRARRRSADPLLRQVAVGWTTSLVALSLAACTVHLWNMVFAYFFFFLGLGGWIADQRRGVRQPQRRLREARPLRGQRRGGTAAPVAARLGG